MLEPRMVSPRQDVLRDGGDAVAALAVPGRSVERLWLLAYLLVRVIDRCLG
jgi:hypothetical protein